DQLDIERADLEAAAERYHGNRDLRRARLAFAFGAKQRGGERRRVDRDLQPRPQIDERAEMVLVRMGEHDGGEVATLLLQVADVGQDDVDAGQMLLRREGDAAVDRQPLAAV